MKLLYYICYSLSVPLWVAAAILDGASFALNYVATSIQDATTYRVWKVLQSRIIARQYERH